MDAEKLLLALSPNEKVELLAALSDEAITAEVSRRGIAVSGVVGETALQAAGNSPEGEATSAEHVVTQPIYKNDFMQYIADRLPETDNLKRRAQKGAISRVWTGFLYLHKGTADKHIKLEAIDAEEFVGAARPEFERITYKNSWSGVENSRVDEDHSDGLDMVQAANYLVAIHSKIQSRHFGLPLNSKIAGDVIKQSLPQYSFLGCQLLCEFMISRYVIAEHSGYDVTVRALSEAANYFRALSEQTSSTTLKDSTVLQQ